MLDRLAALHYPHNGGLSFEVSIRRYALVRGFVLFLGFLELNLVDLDPHLGVAESCVVRELIRLVHILALGSLDKNAIFGTGK